jgi:hypothetical protein
MRVRRYRDPVSLAVELGRLREQVDAYGPTAYLLSVGENGRPHAVIVRVAWAGDRLTASVGTSTAANATARPGVSLLWPPHDEGGYSLIVDGDATVRDDDLWLRPTKAVLHRPAPDNPHRAECVTLLKGQSI